MMQSGLKPSHAQCSTFEHEPFATDGSLAILALTRFHMFDLARVLRQLGCRVRLLTGTPRFKIDEDLKDIARIRPWLVGSLALAQRLGVRLPYQRWWEWASWSDLARWARRHLKGVRLLDALSNCGLEAGRFVKENGGAYICNRGSSHILYQKRILEEEHARWGAPPPDFPQWVADREMEEYETADAVVVPSTFTRRTFLEMGVPPEKVYLCPYGVDLSFFQPLPKEDGIFRVLFVGGFSNRKGIGYLFEAVRPLVQAGRMEVWLIGGPNPEAREVLARNRDLYINQGWHPRKELSWFYSQGSVLVLPSIEEGLALVQAQAMACGLPVIATTNTGAEDLFTDGMEGFIVPIRDPLAIREKIEWLLDHPQEREEMGRAALCRVQSLGGWRTYGEKCLAMYRQVMARATKTENYT